MARGLNGWSYKDVVAFLRDHEFFFSHPKFGSHEAWVRIDPGGKQFVVEVNFLQGGKTYPTLTLLTMIRQSGVDRKEWRQWVSR